MLHNTLSTSIPLQSNNGARYPPPQFFPGIKVNFVEHIFQGRSERDTAIIACVEGGTDHQTITISQLRARVEVIANTVIASVVKVGDRIAAVIPNCVEAIEVCPAALSIVAVWSISSPGMRFEGIAERMVQINSPSVSF